MLNLARTITLTLVAVLGLAASAAAGGGSPFNGHYAGTSLNGRQHVDVNIDGGRARTTNLKLRCAGRRTVFADFRLSERLTAKGRFTARARSFRASVRGGATVKLVARAAGGRLTGTLTATAGGCDIGPVRFVLKRSGGQLSLAS